MHVYMTIVIQVPDIGNSSEDVNLVLRESKDVQVQLHEQVLVRALHRYKIIILSIDFIVTYYFWVRKILEALT